ncbi:hypothetical protein [Veillonella intestinalis]|uniref:hypothetical protein n=1 Tax=Veillonella intestinalis TaxID=2941341 RepID=UPI00203D1DA0|nr:hypothetical protein [Veillonella intestinalis]
MRELFSALIEVNTGLPRTMVIAQLHWRRLAESAQYEAIRQKGKWYETTIARGNQELTARLKEVESTHLSIKPKKLPLSVTIPMTVVPWHRFSRSEIIEFVTAVKDGNPIHQQIQAVVPGCLVLEMLEKYITHDLNDLAQSISVRFRRPTFEDELVSVTCEGSTIQGYTAEKAVFTCTWT